MQHGRGAVDRRIAASVPEPTLSGRELQRGAGGPRADRQRPTLVVDGLLDRPSWWLAEPHRMLTRRAIVRPGRERLPEPIPMARRWSGAQATGVNDRLRRPILGGLLASSEVAAGAPPATVNGNRRLRPYRAWREGWRCSPMT